MIQYLSYSWRLLVWDKIGNRIPCTLGAWHSGMSPKHHPMNPMSHLEAFKWTVSKSLGSSSKWCMSAAAHKNLFNETPCFISKQKRPDLCRSTGCCYPCYPSWESSDIERMPPVLKPSGSCSPTKAFPIPSVKNDADTLQYQSWYLQSLYPLCNMCDTWTTLSMNCVWQAWSNEIALSTNIKSHNLPHWCW